MKEKKTGACGDPLCSLIGCQGVEYHRAYIHGVLSAATPSIHFTPGVPTEDEWYVVKVDIDGKGYYHTYQVMGGVIYDKPDAATILSHAKLPEL
jgi:hypothetical protein